MRRCCAAVRRRVPGKTNAQRPAIAQSIEDPSMARSGATPEAWHWQPHHFQSRRDLWHAMLLEADTESVRLFTFSIANSLCLFLMSIEAQNSSYVMYILENCRGSPRFTASFLALPPVALACWHFSGVSALHQIIYRM